MENTKITLKTLSTEPPMEAPLPRTPVKDDDYQWPSNLYIEANDMAAISFLIYTFAYLIDVVRKEDGLIGIDGIKSETNGEVLPRRSFSPEEVLDLIENNIETLRKYHPNAFKEGQSLANLQKMIQESNQSGLERPLTLQDFSDKYQRHEMVYAITKDDVNKRISVVFRGTENKLALKTNWLSNANIRKVKAELPKVLDEVVSKIYLHTGFYKYIFSKTMDEKDDPSNRKYDVIMKECKILLEENPGYKLYVTGHSLGAALSSIFAFYAACDEDIPKPVTCINFASPRVGNKSFQIATQWLEKQKMLRLVRFVNDNDLITTVPMFNYHHAGIAARLYDSEKEPKIEYAGGDEGGSFSKYFSRIWNNSIIANLDLTYDHGNYRSRINKDKAALEKLDLNKVYKKYHPVKELQK